MPGYVYLIHDKSNNAYKIGVTRNLDKRLTKLQTGNSNKLILLEYYKCEYPFRLETILHNIYSQYKILNEWFDLPEDDVENFMITCAKCNKRITALKCNPFFAKNLK